MAPTPKGSQTVSRTSPDVRGGHRGRSSRAGGTTPGGGRRRRSARLPIVGIAVASVIGGLIGLLLSVTGNSATNAAAPVRLAAAQAAIAATAPAPADPGNADPAAGPAEAAPGDCTLVVPANPLTAKGLATPYQLTAAAGGTCHQANPDQAAFVQATVIDPATGKVSVYNPLVIDAGTQPAAPTVTPALPPNAVVGVWFGFNGNNLALQKSGGKVTVRHNHRRIGLRGSGNSLAQGKCVNGTPNSVFGQFAYCNAPAFFAAANKAVKAGQLAIPPLATAPDGKPCPTTRDFGVVDQDQSDNVTATYLLTADGRTAQATDANANALAGAQVITNASDNGLLVNFIDKAIGCDAFTAPDLANNGTPTSSLALDELQAGLQAAPVALVPPNNPMTLVNGTMSRVKTNLYRAGSNMPPLQGSLTAAAKAYCTSMTSVGQARLQLDQAQFTAFASPDPAAATNLFTFLGMRLADSYVNLNCQALTGQPNPVTVQTNGDIVTGVTFGGAGAAPATTAPAAGGTPAPSTPPAGAATSAAPAAGPGRGHRP